MKKKVRIYKSPDGNGAYINKTSKFLTKAQMGGAPDVSMLGYPGAQQSQEQDGSDQIVQVIASDITSQIPKEKTIFKLVNIMGIPADSATQLYMAVAEQITNDIEKSDDASYEEETGMQRKKDEALSEDEVITQNPEEDNDFDYGLNDDEGSEIAMQSSEGPDVLDEALDPLSDEYRYGGAYQTGGSYSYALPSPDDISNNTPETSYDMISQMAWHAPADKTSNTDNMVDYPNAILDYSKLQTGGMYKKAKKKYISSVMTLLKKELGGQDGDTENPNNGDPTGDNFRENKLKAFTSTVKRNAEMSAMQKALEQQYDQMMQNGGETDPENPMHHLNLYSQATAGIFNEPMNETVKAQNGLNVPKGFYKRTMRRFGNIPNLTSVDVRRTGLFGPTKYRMEFDPSPLQQLNNPVTAEMYGYGSGLTQQRKPSTTRTWDAEKVYTNLLEQVANAEAPKEEVKTTTPEKTTEDTKEPKKAVVPKTYANAAPVVTVPEPQIVRDAWGRPLGSKWFGFNPKTKKWETEQEQVDFTPGLTKIKNDIENYQPFNQEWNAANYMRFNQVGGTVENIFDSNNGLQKFVGGGYDPSEDQIDYSDSIDSSDPYFQEGGNFIKNFVPANLVRSRQNDVVQRVYNPVTGESRMGAVPGAGNYLSAIDVRKSSLLGTPKKYTIYYGAHGDPRTENLITLNGSGASEAGSKTSRDEALANAGYGDRTDVSGLKMKSKAAIRQGERKRDRELKKLYKEDPTNVAFTKTDVNAPFDYEVDMPGQLPVRSAQEELNKLIKQGPEHIATQAEKDALKSQLNMDYIPSVPNYNDVLGNSNEVNLQQPKSQNVVNQSLDFEDTADAEAGWGQPKDLVYFDGTLPLEGPRATEEDQIMPFEQEYMQGYEPTITPQMINEASQLQMSPQMTDMGAWSGMSNPADILAPGVNPFDLPVNPRGEQYYPPFAQPSAPVRQRTQQVVNQAPAAGPTLDQMRNQQRKNPNIGKPYTYNFNPAGAEKDPEYSRAINIANKDGVITEKERANAMRLYDQRIAENEKLKLATQAQRTIAQIDRSSSSAAEKKKAKEKVLSELSRRQAILDKGVQQRFNTNYTDQKAFTSRQYGGDLSRFIGGGTDPAFTGANPVVYTNNPAMQGKSDVDLITLNPGIQGAQGQVNWGQMSPTGHVTQMNNDGSKTYGADATYKGTQPKEITVDPMQLEEHQVGKTYAEPLAFDVKNKLTQGEREARLIAGNSLMRGVAGVKNRLDDSKAMKGFYDNYTADNLYASDPSRDRGDYADSGLYRPDDQGQTWNSRSAQYGGSLGEDPDYVEGDETYMTEDEIRQYMAQGGQIEFI